MSKNNTNNNSPATETITIDGCTVVLKYAQQSNTAVLKNIREILVRQDNISDERPIFCKSA